MKKGNIVIDKLGRASQRFIGRLGEVVVNSNSGKINSVNSPSIKKVP